MLSLIIPDSAQLFDRSYSAEQHCGRLYSTADRLCQVSTQQEINPIDRNAAADEKIKQLQKLSQENEPIVRGFLEEIDRKYNTKSSWSYKTADSIAAKSSRPSILDENPSYNVENIRDSFRFKTVLRDLNLLPQIAKDLKNSGFTIVKTDTEKILEPGLWGWRIAVFDLKMPNGQLVEYYLPVSELDDAKNAGNHKLYRQWRSRDEHKLSDPEKKQLSKARKLSRNRYDKAWLSYLKRTGATPARIREILNQTTDATQNASAKDTDFEGR